MTSYIFHPEAVQDLDEIWDFISRDSVDAADQVIDDIRHAIESLVRFPYQGHRRTDLTSRGLRFLVVSNYLVVYAPEDRPLVVVGILHGRRNPRVMAAILRGRE
jgi:toxin ParE1/3/4